MQHATSRGITKMLCANIVFCMMACLVRLLAECSAWTTTLFRFLMGIGIVGFLAMSGKIELGFVNNKGLFFRGFIGGIATALFFYSITRIGLIRAGFIASLYPAFATLFGCLFLGERISVRKVIALGGALTGVAVLLHNRSGSGGFIGTINRYDLLALTGSMLAGLAVVSIKKLQSTDSTIAIFFAQCLVGAGIVFVPASITTVAVSPGSLGVLLSIGILATAGQLLLTDSFRHLSVATGSILVMTTPVFNCLAGLVFFHEPLSLQTGIGAVIILGSSAGLLLDIIR
jgi:drug/metabolite transporter (DMT)-like permease